jgi:hypothetical protein
LRPLSKVSVTTPDCVMVPYWPWLKQIYGTRPISCGKPLQRRAALYNEDFGGEHDQDGSPR